MNLKLVRKPPEPKKAKRKMPAKQLGGVESPATVLLHPVHFNPDNKGPASWWSYDGILIGGIKINGVEAIDGGTRSDTIAYLPTPVPRSWGEKEFIGHYQCPVLNFFITHLSLYFEQVKNRSESTTTRFENNQSNS